MAKDSLPTEAEVRSYVRLIVFTFARIPETVQVPPDSVLKKAPISFDDKGLLNVALALRGYVKQWRPKQTIGVAELRKSGLTFEALQDLVWTRSQAG